MFVVSQKIGRDLQTHPGKNNCFFGQIFVSQALITFTAGNRALCI